MVITTESASLGRAARTPLELSLRKNGLEKRGLNRWTPVRWEVGTLVARSLLDHVLADLRGGGPESAEGAMGELFSGLYRLRASATPEIWRDIICECVNHPICQIIHEDPFTARSFHKPRGYAGDALLIDYIYTRDPLAAGRTDVSPLGELIFGFTTGAPASAGVRTRRDMMAAIIDQTCSVTNQPSVLSVACGHLREAGLCRSVAAGEVGRFVALDQDELSLQVVRESAASDCLVTVCNSIKSLFRGELAGERFDLIYSTGLYDYLDDRIANRLTARMFEMLNPGGRLVVANFLPDIWCSAFMETFMGWQLIYRSPEQMLQLTSSLPQEEVGISRTFIEKNANIVVLDLIRR